MQRADQKQTCVARAVIIEGRFVLKFLILLILFSRSFVYFQSFHFVFPHIILLSVPKFSPLSVEFPIFGNVSCFSRVLVSLGTKHKRKIWKNKLFDIKGP